MSQRSPRRVPTPGKRVEEGRDIPRPSPVQTSRNGSRDSGKRDPNRPTISEVKKLNFATTDYSQKFFARVVCLMPPKQYKSQDVHFHRRELILADKTDFIRGFIRSNDDNIVVLGESYFFCMFKMFRKSEILIHEESTVFE